MQRINNNLSRYFNERILRKLQPPSAEMRNAPRSGAHSRTAARTARAMCSHATRHAQRSLSQPPSLWRHTEVCTRMHAGPSHRAKSQRRRTPPSPRRGPETQYTGSGGTACNQGGCVIRFRVHAQPISRSGSWTGGTSCARRLGRRRTSAPARRSGGRGRSSWRAAWPGKLGHRAAAR